MNVFLLLSILENSIFFMAVGFIYLSSHWDIDMNLFCNVRHDDFYSYSLFCITLKNHNLKLLLGGIRLIHFYGPFF